MVTHLKATNNLVNTLSKFKSDNTHGSKYIVLEGTTFLSNNIIVYIFFNSSVITAKFSRTTETPHIC